jgi:hypothetical protein
MEPIQLEFTLDAAAYSRLMQRILLKRGLIWIAVIGGIVLINALVSPEFGGVWLIALLFFGLIWYFTFKFILRRSFKAATNLHHPIRYIFDEKEVKVETANSQTTHAWSAFTRTVELPEWFLLYQNKIVFNPIPKSAFKSNTEAEQFRELLKTKGLN